MVNGLRDLEFQNDCVDFLIDRTADPESRQIITVKAPTGAGKTVILIKYIDGYLKNTDRPTAFVWLCPGKGDLEQQSKEKMDEITPETDTRTLLYSMFAGFDAESVTFINWELVTKKGNQALKAGERANLFEMIEDARKKGVEFIVIIDEEHMNNTKKADDIIHAFGAKNIIRVSATANKVPHHEFYEIPEEEVISAGLITRAIYVNEGVEEKREYGDDDDYNYLLKLADEKRKEIAESYKRAGSRIRPLVLIQFPAGKPETVKLVEEKLAELGYTYENGMVAVWMSGVKKNTEQLTKPDGSPAFLLMKQAISTGWDCPRAKILVKLREGGSEDFQIQTIGRIRRMPERRHYGNDALDYCYIYTFDENYKEGLLSTMDKAYQVRKLFIRDEARGFELVKELRNLDYSGLGERETLEKIYAYFKTSYDLCDDMDMNREKLEAAGYNFAREIDSRIVKGIFYTTGDLAEGKKKKNVGIKTRVNTHTHGIYLLHAVDEIKRAAGMQSQKVKNILRRMFQKGKKTKYKFVALENDHFYAFIINNVKRLKADFGKVTSRMSEQRAFVMEPKIAKFTIPETEVYKYCEVKQRREIHSNAYKGYTNEFITDRTRSMSEILFEKYCESSDKVRWVYKNGDTGRQYLSIVYLDGLQKQWLFYPDYVVQMKDGTIWIIETKGGERAGHSKNIDQQVENKFAAFREYAQRYHLCWGFVRDMDENLYINNTQYADDMTDGHWRPLEKVF